MTLDPPECWSSSSICRHADIVAA
ncbi:MAG: hypothetical protein CAF41_012180 [Nitrospira sp. CG24A]|nr:MAG: hypothetical protein CAF41_012180 [Nitrospira sp. CG24A]